MALSMSRRDISDYLGLTIETVSRTLSSFKRTGLPEGRRLIQRDIVVLTPAGLAEQDSQACI
ncbi:helix-turn-helix domain-containing protein [Bradyrhizobium valentinum]